MPGPLLDKRSAPVGYPRDWYDNLKRIDPYLDLMWAQDSGPVQAHWVVVHRLPDRAPQPIWAMLTDDDKCREVGSNDLLIVAHLDSHACPGVKDEFKRRFDAMAEEEEDMTDIDNAVDAVLDGHARTMDLLDHKLRAVYR